MRFAWYLKDFGPRSLNSGPLRQTPRDADQVLYYMSVRNNHKEGIV